jgi:hypothetical protein
MQVFDVLEHEIIKWPNDSVEEEDNFFTSKLRHVAQSELHKIVAQPRIMPYNDMISWALEHVNIQTRSIINHQQVVIDSFRLENLQVMYKLSPTPKYTYNDAFFLEFEIKECTQYVKNDHDIVKTWWGHPEKFRANAHGMYTMTYLDSHMSYVAMMIYRMFGKKNPTHL